MALVALAPVQAGTAPSTRSQFLETETGPRNPRRPWKPLGIRSRRRRQPLEAREDAHWPRGGRPPRPRSVLRADRVGEPGAQPQRTGDTAKGPHRPEGTEQGADRWPIHLSTRHSSSHARGEVQNSGLGQPGDGHRNPSEAAQVRRRWGAPGQAQSPREQPGDPSTPLGASPPKETWGRRGHQVPPGGPQQGRPASPPSGTSTARAVGGTLARTCRGRTRDRLTGEWTPASPHLPLHNLTLAQEVPERHTT